MSPVEETHIETSEESEQVANESVVNVQISAAGPTRFGGIITEDFLPELRWPRAYGVYDEMRKNSPVVGGFLRAIESAFRGIDFKAIPYDSSPLAQERAWFLESVFDDFKRPFASNIMTDILTMFPFGFAPMEMVCKWRKGNEFRPTSKYNDGMIGFHDWSLIRQNTVHKWIYDESKDGDPNELIGITQNALTPIASGRSPVQDIPIDKILNFRIRAEADNPEGESILRQGYRSYYFVTNLEVVEAISVERVGAGIPMITLPQGASTSEGPSGSQSDEARARKVVKSIRADEQGGIVLPFDWKFELVTARSVRPELFDLAIKRHRANLLISVLAVFLEMGTARVGSFATAKTGRSFFEVAFDAYVKSIEDVINEQAVPYLFFLNGVDDGRLPRLGHASLAGEDLEQVVNAVEKLITLQVLDVDPVLKDHMRHLIRVPQGGTIEERQAVKGGIDEPPTEAGIPIDPAGSDSAAFPLDPTQPNPAELGPGGEDLGAGLPVSY